MILDSQLSEACFVPLLSSTLLLGYVELELTNRIVDTKLGIRRRGMSIEALTDYMLMQGPSQAMTNMEWDSIWNMNKKVIDPVVPRFVALEKTDLYAAFLFVLSLTSSTLPL